MSTAEDGSSGWRLRVHASLPSTSDFCVEAARAGEPDGLAVLALVQTAGRGSRGRAWTAPSGNLNLSLLLRPGGSVAAAGQWALLAGVAVADALAPYAGEPGALQLKWPNDLLLRGGKLAGILIDAADVSGRIDWIVLGIGVNVAHRPALPDRPTACLAEAGATPAPEPLARAILASLARWRGTAAVAGFAAVRAAWSARAQPLGTPLSIVSGSRRFEGRFAGLADDGALLLETEEGTRALQTGEILFPEVAHASGD